MIYWSVVLLVLALIAGIFGFGDITDSGQSLAQALFFISMIGCVFFLISGFLFEDSEDGFKE